MRRYLGLCCVILRIAFLVPIQPDKLNYQFMDAFFVARLYEMSGVSAASDIWSVGCTAIELLTCVPPHYELQPMPALYRILQVIFHSHRRAKSPQRFFFGAFHSKQTCSSRYVYCPVTECIYPDQPSLENTGPYQGLVKM